MAIRILLAMAGILLLAGLALVGAVCVCAHLPRRAQNADCLIVLGAKVHPDGRLSHSLQYRCEAALRARQAGVARVIIACGGRGGNEPCTEAEAMRRFMLERGLPAADVICEDRSTNTVENLRNARAFMEAHGFRRAALVTSDYHLTRALWIARDAGLDVCGISAASPLRPLHYLKARLRESVSWLLYFKYKLYGNERLS